VFKQSWSLFLLLRCRLYYSRVMKGSEHGRIYLKIIIYICITSPHFTLVGFRGTLMQNIAIVHTKTISCLCSRVYSAPPLYRLQAVRSDVTGANRFDPLNIAPYSCQVLITIRSDQDIVFDSDTTDRFIFLEDIMIDMLRISYGCQEMR